MVEIHNLIQPGLEQIFLPALSTFFRSHPDIRCCFATSIESRHQRQINLQANLCPSRQNWQKRILTASENRFPLKRLRVLHGRRSNAEAKLRLRRPFAIRVRSKTQRQTLPPESRREVPHPDPPRKSGAREKNHALPPESLRVCATCILA